MTDSKEIRQALKTSLGLNARQVSVRVVHYSKIVFTIRDASVDFKAVQSFASKFESIDRCQATGEILSGGNTFVDVQVSEEVEQAWKAAHQGEILPILESTRGELSDGTSLFFADNIVHIYMSGESISTKRVENYGDPSDLASFAGRVSLRLIKDGLLAA